MKRISEIFRKDGPYKRQLDSYDKENFGLKPGQKAPWDIHTQDWYEEQDTVSPEDIDTIPMPATREDLEGVQDANTLEEALWAYDNRYSLPAIEAGEQSPQFAAEMLLRIGDKFNDSMTPEQRYAVAMETITMGHAIGRLAEKPIGKSKDRTSLKGLVEMAEILTIAQEYAPEEIPALEKEMRHVADKVESRITKYGNGTENVISGPILVALEEFDRLSPEQKKETPFKKIFEKIEHERLNESENKLLAKERTRSDQERSPEKQRETSTQALDKRKLAQIASTAEFILENDGSKIYTSRDNQKLSVPTKTHAPKKPRTAALPLEKISS